MSKPEDLYGAGETIGRVSMAEIENKRKISSVVFLAKKGGLKQEILKVYARKIRNLGKKMVRPQGLEPWTQ